VSAPPPTVLDRILAETRVAVEARKRERPLGATADPGGAPGAGGQRRAAPGTGAFGRALQGPEVAVIAEFKRHSPSAGSLGEEPELLGTVSAYERGGAAAISVLTEEPNFHGSLQDLRAARAACALPLLRKDFIVDPYQLHEALEWGASAVLLIVAALSDGALSQLHDGARALGLDALVEVHDAGELERALAAGAQIVGVNNRDLRDFTVDIGRTEQLAGLIPAEVTIVSESGIRSPEQLARLGDAGVSAVLVGEALMRSSDPARTLRELMGARTQV